MARIRTIKPEFWTSEQVMACSTTARLLFVGLWNFCDDAGRMPVSFKTIKALVFPADDFTADDIARMFDELSSNGLLFTYSVDGKNFFQVTGWHHQRIDRPQKPKCPPPPSEHSSNTLRSFAVGREGKGEEGKGNAADAAKVVSIGKTPEAELYERAERVLGKNSGGIVSQLRKAKDGSIPLVRAIIETASTKHNPREYVNAIIRGATDPPNEYIDPRL